jgi:hypothetical protein
LTRFGLALIADSTGILDLMRSSLVELIAHAIHQRWRAERAKAGQAAPEWDELDESRKESSREHARDIPAKLHTIRCDIAPLQAGGGTHGFAFTANEIETLAAAEHVRWVRERVADGWTAGPRDATSKTTPYLVAFDELPTDIAEYDRILVREIPELLASAGLQVVRRPNNTTPKPIKPSA